MGTQLEGDCLSTAELAEHRETIQRKSLEDITQRFDRAYQHAATDTAPAILSAGVEFEFTLTQNGVAVPAYDRVARHLRNVSPELTKQLIETKTDTPNLFSLDTPFHTIVDHCNQLVTTIRRAAEQEGLRALMTGGHPSFNAPTWTDHVSDNPRYHGLIRALDNFGTNTFTITYTDGQEPAQGTLWEGYATPVQLTTKVPLAHAGTYHDAANLIQPLLLMASAATPFINNRPTTWNSARINVLPPATYGRTKEEQAHGKPGRMRMLGPLTKPGITDLDTTVMDRLRALNIHRDIATYVAHIATDGHLLVTHSDLNKDTDFPAYTCWPFTKLRYDTLMDGDGIGVELRVGENMGTTRENASFFMTSLAMLQSTAEDLIDGTLRPLSQEDASYNLAAATYAYQPGEYPDLHWNGHYRCAQSIMRRLAERASAVLKNRAPDDIGDILNPVIAKFGLHYNGRGITDIPPEANVAMRLREHAFQLQPETHYEQPLAPHTITTILEDYT